MAKLTDTQLDILNKMKNGWELGRYFYYGTGGTYRYHLQKGGLGYGGEVLTIKSNTVAKLRDRGLIKAIHNTIDPEIYVLA